VKELRVFKMVCVILAFCLAVAVTSSATTTFRILVEFQGKNGADPNAQLIQATDGNFYGTTYAGGNSANCTNGCGTIFKMSPAGALTTLHSFCAETGCPDGASPAAGLLQGTDGNFYGTTVYGGTHDFGTVFKITPAGTLTTIYSFAGSPDGAYPRAALLLGSGGNLYGTTEQGGAYNWGSDFKVTLAGAEAVVHSFDTSLGANPYSGLIPVPDGLEYVGTTAFGGNNSSSCLNGSCGILYKITPAGALTWLHSFSGSDGGNPYSALYQGTSASFYGTNYDGGTGTNCTNGCGTVFEYTVATHVLKTLHDFAGYPTDGAQPNGGVLQATDGNFYGTTSAGGVSCPTNGCGTIFAITGSGALTTLHDFAGHDGNAPAAGLLQATDGNFYGTTSTGGSGTACTDGCGTIFRLSVGLAPFVTSQTYSGIVGAKVVLLGTNFTGAIAVSFNGTAATTFTVVSPSEITTTVPAGATTGPISVTTPSAILKSNTSFYVAPQVLSFTPTSGSVGTSVEITGVSLTQTVGVAFGGVKATSFTVNSDTQVTAVVPTGAVTGRVAVSTPGGSGTSPTNFTVE
jgi:uncharacterized repeat protein (TIGR03803 family)